MMRFATGLVCLAAVSLLAGPASAEDFAFPYSISFHMGSPTYSGCAEGSMADGLLSCGMVNVDGADFGPYTPVFCWFLVGGVPENIGGLGEPGGIGGIQFGIMYEPTVRPSGWTLCTGGSEIPQNDLDGVWPAAGTGNAMTFGGGCSAVTANVDGMTRLGFMPLTPADTGAMLATEDPRIGIATASDCVPNSYRVCRQSMGSAVAHPLSAPCDEYFAQHELGYPVSPCNTCGAKCPVPTLDSSWGLIKSQYR